MPEGTVSPELFRLIDDQIIAQTGGDVDDMFLLTTMIPVADRYTSRRERKTFDPAYQH